MYIEAQFVCDNPECLNSKPVRDSGVCLAGDEKWYCVNVYTSKGLKMYDFCSTTCLVMACNFGFTELRNVAREDLECKSDGRVKKTKEEKIFALFEAGCKVKSVRLKRLVPKYTTRARYYSNWKRSKEESHVGT